MKTYLVSIDFSEASVHAAKFAAALSHQTDVEHIVLMNTHYVTIYETTLPTPDMVQVTEAEIEEDFTERLKKLDSLKHDIYKLVRPGVEITTHLNRTHLVRAIVENVYAKNADLVVIGSVGNSSRNEVKLGSHVTRISKLSPVPVLIVPPTYDFKAVDRVVIACDFTKVTETIPMAALKKLLDRKRFELFIVNVDSQGKHNHNDAEQIAQETALYDMLKPYRPEYHFVSDNNVLNGIIGFAADKDAQLVIALPHKYSFFQSIVHNSVSKQLAESASVPVLLLK